jgi:hypothetical protein
MTKTFKKLWRLDNTEWDEMIIMNGYWLRIWKKAFVAYFKALA